MNYRKADSMSDLFWQKMRNPLTFWPRIILTLLILIAFWSHSVWWIIFLFFVEAAVIFFAPPASKHENWITRAMDGFRIWTVVRSTDERNTMLIMFIFVTIAFLAALWTHSLVWIFFFGVQIAIAKLLLIRRFTALARNEDYDVEMGLTVTDIQAILSRCNLTN
ncbi:hypothetical protein [Halodesulfovibrio marinisediminis]|uniref:Uncharacterized protein n=1 Tax=Halodesulfovibrio marinisediminis DSM 17456 TaxID=1121457 RepID=A0A1N6IUL2_9BACT|nr:hypothetical protein [Halodesulfovibrio marinisediminis]SIO35694.1 hypothetical protein SAMN02745161_2950 [Halodesulfovibrio marinisediminis DSM 17456]